MVKTNKTQCFTCHRENNTYTCEGCSNRFCVIHLTEHQQLLNEQLHHIIDGYNEFKQRINQQKQSPLNHSLIKKIDQWERNSIEKVKQKAQECREVIIELLQTCINNIEMKFNDLNKQIQQLQKENDFNEIQLNHLRNQLRKITEELHSPSNISIQRESQSLINDISIISERKSKVSKWKQSAISMAGGNGEGQELNQLNRPFGIFIDKNKNIFIADDCNHRIVKWKYNAEEGQIIAGGNSRGNRMDQLNRPTNVIVDQPNHSIIIADSGNRRVIQWLNQDQQILTENIDCCGLAIDKNGFLYVSDIVKNEVRRWEMGEYDEGIVVAGGNDEGDGLNQFNHPNFIFVDEDQSVYVSDTGNHRVMKWRKGAKEGTVVAGGNGEGGNFNQLSYPRGVIVDHLDQIYVADFGNDRVMRWCEGNDEGEIVVGGNGKEDHSNYPRGEYKCQIDDERSIETTGPIYVEDLAALQIEKGLKDIDALEEEDFTLEVTLCKSDS
ncbi:unnamed protein product [Adineta steineri]|uniref:Uncharacterized protein n=1 Tax=Adineta steineri TaxID=433720 RepID=A0A819L228_9BILA|nr:unnamed protein product [Adineta steineri]CAF3955583.1 unnamed protein product [Adineta steineri]